MSLYKKIVFLLGTILLAILSATLAIVYFESRSIIERQVQTKAVSVIMTVDSVLESGISYYQYQAILIYLKKQDADIQSFDIYERSGSYYNIASTVPSRIGTQAGASIVQAIQTKHLQVVTSGSLLDVTAPVYVSGQPLYAVHVQFSVARDLQVIGRLLTNVLVVGLIAMGIAVIAVWYFARRMVSEPLFAITSAADQIAKGHLDIHVERHATRHDEIGMLARSFVSMVRNLRELIAGISQAAEQLTASFEGLIRSTDQATSGASHVSTVIHRIADATAEQISSSDDSFLAMTEVNGTLDSVVLATASASELSGNAAQQSKKGGRVLRDVVARTDSLVRQVDEVMADNHTLLQYARDIEQIAALFGDMTAQANLKVLSAAIAQEPFGEHEKRLATTIDDVRLLAEQATHWVSQLSQLVYNLQAETTVAVGKVEQISEAVVSGWERARGCSDAVRRIARLSGQIAEQMDSNALAIGNVWFRAKDALSLIQGAAQTSSASGVQVREVADIVGKQLNAIQEVNRSASLLSEMAVDLQQLVMAFDLSR